MQFDKRDPLTADAPYAADLATDAEIVSQADDHRHVRAAQPVAAKAESRRTARCPCGSGKRYKHCCGAHAAQILKKSHAVIVHEAVYLMNIGEATRAERLLSELRAAEVREAAVALEAGEIYLDLHCLAEAAQWLERALSLDSSHPRILAAHAECRTLMARRSTWLMAAEEIGNLLERVQGRARPLASSEQVHIVCKLDTIGGTERRALNLHRCLSSHARVSLWSAAPAASAHTQDIPVRRIAADSAPSGGTVIIVGTYFDCGDWLQTQPFERVVICHNLSEQHPSLLRRLRQIEANPSSPRVDLTFPSALFRDACGLPGRVEYTPVDVDHFRRTGSAPGDRAHLRVGRHGRAYPWKFHPNDPAFFRRLIACGHAVRILGGSVIADAFARDAGPRPELLEVGALDAREFLENLDVFIFRKHPHCYETGGTVILEAMAMQLPVVVFAEDCGYVEVLVHGENGFVVDSEEAAFACIDRLHADPALRVRIGAAARATVVTLMREQESALLDYYLNCPRAPRSKRVPCDLGC